MAISEVSGHKAFNPSLASMCRNTNRNDAIAITNIYLETAMKNVHGNGVYLIRPSTSSETIACTVSICTNDRINNYRCVFDPELKKWKVILPPDKPSLDPQDKLEDLVESVIPADCKPVDSSLTFHKVVLLWAVNSDQLMKRLDQWGEVIKQSNNISSSLFMAAGCFFNIKQKILKNTIEFEDVLDIGGQLTSFRDFIEEGENFPKQDQVIVKFNEKEMTFLDWKVEFLNDFLNEIDPLIASIAEGFPSPASVVKKKGIDDLKVEFEIITSFMFNCKIGSNYKGAGSMEKLYREIRALATSDSVPDLFRLISKLKDFRSLTDSAATRTADRNPEEGSLNEGSEGWKEGMLKPFLKRVDDITSHLIESLK